MVTGYTRCCIVWDLVVVGDLKTRCCIVWGLVVVGGLKIPALYNGGTMYGFPEFASTIKAGGSVSLPV